MLSIFCTFPWYGGNASPERYFVFDGKNDLAFFICYFAALTVICVLALEYYEKPMRKWVIFELTRWFLGGGEPPE